MALDTLPLFVTSTSGAPDLDELKARMRLTGVVVDSNAEQIVHSVIQGVRGKLYARLGITKVANILTTNPVAAPATEVEIIRSIAYEAEILWVIADLMCRLPMMFMDAGSATEEVYNNEGAFRSMDRETLESCKAEFKQQIDEWLSIMAGDVSLGNVGGALTGRAFTQVNQDPKLYPAGSIRGDNGVLFTNPAAARALGLIT